MQAEILACPQRNRRLQNGSSRTRIDESAVRTAKLIKVVSLYV